MVKNILVWGLTILVAVGGYAYYKYKSVTQLASMYRTSTEIAGSSVTKDGDTWTMHMTAAIDKPLDDVWTKGMKEPERSASLMPDTFRKSELKKTEGNKKVIDFQVILLGLPVQNLTAEITWDDPAHKMHVTTTGGMQKIDGTYSLEPGPTGTNLKYDATAVDQVSVPIPQSVVEGALREFFIVQVRAIKKAVGVADDKKAEVAAADFHPICEKDPVWEGRKLVSLTVTKAKEAPLPPPDKDTSTPSATGYDRTYAAGNGKVGVKENYKVDGLCTTAIATVGGTTVQVQAKTLMPNSVKDWVELMDWAKIAETPAPDKASAELFWPKYWPKGWELDPSITGPKSDDALGFKVFDQRLF